MQQLMCNVFVVSVSLANFVFNPFACLILSVSMCVRANAHAHECMSLNTSMFACVCVFECV